MFFLNFIARIVLSPLMPVIEMDLNLDHGQAGMLFLLIAMGYFIALMASGYVSSRLRHRNTIILSAVAVGLACMATSCSQGLWSIRAGVFGIGAAAGLYFPSAMATITSLFTPNHWGKAISVHELAPNLAFIAAPLLSDLLLQWVSWRGTLLVVGLASLLLGLALIRFGRGGEFPGEAPALGFLRGLFREPVFWIMVALFGLGISSTVGVYSMLPLFLVSERGMNPEQANTVVALSRIPSLGMALLSGWVADYIGAKKTMACALLFTGILTLFLGLVPGIWMLVVIFSQAMLAVCFFPAAFSALSSIAFSSSPNLIISFTIPFAFLAGAGVAPTLIGIFGKEGSFGWGISLVGILLIISSALSAFVDLPDQKTRSRAG
ncbi:MAG TPA: MFS transporter [Syntrophobacteraceae bacterium]|nr:MFS transporter [Syntrophobacteraceae bacterium]